MARTKKPRSDDPWPQRLYFMSLVDAKVGEGVPLVEIAKALGLPTTKSLEFSYRHDFSRVPGRPTLKKAAAYFGVPMRDLYDPSGSAYPTEEMNLAKDFVAGATSPEDFKRLTDNHILDIYRVAIATAKAMLPKG